VKLIWERIAGDFTPHFIAAGRGTLIERLGFECRDGLAAGTVFCRALALNDVGPNVVRRRWIQMLPQLIHR
jgi:hypothetical protein